MDLDQLPDLVLLEIIENLYHDDLKALSSTGPNLCRLAFKRLAHHTKLKEEFGTLVVADEWAVDHKVPTTHPIKLLDRIWKEPCIAHYVDRISFVEQGLLDEKDRETLRRLDSPKGRRFIDSLVQGSPLGDDPELLDECLQAIQSGEETHMLALLFVSLPNLSELRYSQARFNTRFFHRLFTHPSFGASSNLSTVGLYQMDLEDSNSVDDVAIFALAPTVVRFEASELIGGTTQWLEGWNINSVSNVRTICLDEAVLESADLERLLLPMKNLREFRCCLKDMDHDGYEEFQTQEWIGRLAQGVGERLETLSVTCPEGNLTAVRSFKAFPKLKDLEVDLNLLIVDENDNISLDSENDALEQGFHQAENNKAQDLVPRLVDILPPSIERVKIIDRHRTEELPLLFRDLVSEKQTRLPHLREIVYTRATFGMDKDTKDGLRDVGVKVKTIVDCGSPEYSPPPLFDWDQNHADD